MRWANRTITERLAHIGKFIASTPMLKDAVAALRSLYDAYDTKPEGTMLFLTGDTRVGKTTAIDEFIIDMHEEIKSEFGKKPGFMVPDLEDLKGTASLHYVTPNGIRRPIIKILVPSEPTFNGLLADVGYCLTEKRFTRNTPFTERMFILKTQIDKQRNQVLLFDDANHICECNQYDAADVLKVIMKLTRTQVCCSGLPHTTELKEANEQAGEMTFEDHEVLPFRLDLARNSDFMRFLRTVSAQLPFDRTSTIDEPDVALRIGLLSSGHPGRIMLLMHSTIDYAIRNDRNRIDMDTLAYTLKHKRRVADADNVFLMHTDSLAGYPELVRTRKQEVIRAAENRKSRNARHKRNRKSFGARGK